MDNFPWLPVAMIFIAFLGWIRGRIQEAAEARRAKIAEQEQQRREGRGSAQRFESPYQQRPATAASQPRREPKTESEAPAPRSFRDTFEQLARQLQEPEQESEPPRRTRPERDPASEPPQPPTPRSTPTPPPLPSAGPSAQDTMATPSLPPIDAASPILKSPPSRRRRARSDVARALTGSLRDRGELRNALLLREILDAPKGRSRR